MKLFEALKYNGINVEGYGDDFVILNQKNYSIIRRNIVGLVTMKVITRKNKKYSYLLKYDMQNERKIIKRFINMKIICNLLSRNYWDNVEFDGENNVFYITTANAKLKLQHCLKNLVDIEYCDDKVAWALKIDDDNIESVFEVLKNEDILNDKLVKRRDIIRDTFYILNSLCH